MKVMYSEHKNKRTNGNMSANLVVSSNPNLSNFKNKSQSYANRSRNLENKTPSTNLMLATY